MRINSELFGNVLVAHTPDELTEETCSMLRETLENQVDAGHVMVVLQMDRSEAYDSVGLECLLDLQELMRAAGGNIKISGLADPGRKIFEITRLNRHFEVFDSVIDAVSSFQ